MKAPPKLFCPVPWDSICIQPYGVTLCAVSPEDLREREDDSALTLFDSAQLQNIRGQFLKNQWPKECAACRYNEEHGVRSHRLRQLEEPEHVQVMAKREGLSQKPEPISYLELAFDNQCNMKCRMCSPKYSSRWREDLPGLKASGNLDMFGESADFTPMGQVNFWPLIQRLGDSPIISLKGGEPFLNKQFRPFIEELIRLGVAAKSTLRICTNATAVGPWFLAAVAQFKQVSIAISIDGLDPLFRYIRHGRFHLSDLRKNITQLIEVKGQVDVTISTSYQIYNMLSYDAIVKEFMSQTPFFQTTLVLYNWLNPRGAPDPVRKLAMEKVESLRALNWSNSSTPANLKTLSDFLGQGKYEPEHWRQFWKRTLALDQIRGESIQQVLPELMPYSKI